MTSLRACVVGALLLALSATGCTATEPGCVRDAVTARTLGQLQGFTGWLQAHHARGVVGEVGWPAGGQWNALATTWYGAAERAGVGTFVWAAAEQWPASYPLAVYRGSGAAALDVAGPQAPLVERQPAAMRGVALADGSFAASTERGSPYSAQNPGEYGTAYRYPSPASFAFLRDRGITSVRVAFMWERMQPTPGGPLSVVELARLRQVLASAATHRIRVVLDLHSYGRFAARERVLTLGSPALPAAALAELWRPLAAALSHAPALTGYGLMNEPHDLPGGARAWERASQLAVDAVRSVDPSTPVLVAGYSFASAARWATEHPRPWIRVGSGPVLYEAHQYFDRDGSGTYVGDYRTEEAGAFAQGWRRCSS